VSSTLRLPPIDARWATLSGGVFLLSVLVAVVVGSFGWFGFGEGESAGGRVMPAKVIKAEPCNPPGAMETVEFTVDGQTRRADFNGCGHQNGEPVDIRLAPGNTVVGAADATTGSSDNDDGLGLVLLVVAGIAGAAGGLLVRRGPVGGAIFPKARPTPRAARVTLLVEAPAPRMVQATSAAGETQVLH
jgi:hypothetical protein